MNRKTALQIIQSEFAQYGSCTKTAMRAYIENNVSKKAFDGAAKKGLKIFKRRQSNEISI